MCVDFPLKEITSSAFIVFVVIVDLMNRRIIMPGDGKDDDCVCNVDGCSERFQNNESLNTHQVRHGLSLRLSSSSGVSSSLSTPNSSLVTPSSIIGVSPFFHPFLSTGSISVARDETPTPYRFLKDFGRNSSFLDDIVADGESSVTPALRSLRSRRNVNTSEEGKGSSPAPSTADSMRSNPFAETFRKASMKQMTRLKINPPEVTNTDSESLNTPSVPLTADNPLGILSTPEKEAVDGILGTGSDTESTPTKASATDGGASQEVQPSIVEQALESAEIPSLSLDQEPSASINTSQPPCPATSMEEVPDTETSVKQNKGLKKTKNTVKSGGQEIPLINSYSKILPKPGKLGEVVEVTVKMSNGSTVQLPVVPAKSIVSPVATSLSSNASHIPMIPLETPLSSQQSVTLYASEPESTEISHVLTPETTINTTNSAPVPTESIYAPRRTGRRPKPINMEECVSGPRKRGRKSNKEKGVLSKREQNSQSKLSDDIIPASSLADYEMMDDEAKKRYKQELNREAAQRCRMKRRMWVQDLEDKSSILSKKNNELQVSDQNPVELITQTLIFGLPLSLYALTERSESPPKPSVTTEQCSSCPQ